MTIVTVVERLIHWRKKPLAIVLLLFIAGLGVYSLPNRSLSDLTRGELAWPETQDLQEVTLYWIEYRINHEPTYVYYGAVPAFRYYLRYYGLDTEPLPPTWYTTCWNQPSNDTCSKDNIHYGEWFRSRSSEWMYLSIERSLGGTPRRFWLIFSHVYPGEGKLILGELLKRYNIVDSDEQVNASVYLLERNE